MSIAIPNDGAVVTRELMQSIPEPSFTNSWHPISHRKCDIAVEESIFSTGAGIVQRLYSLSKDGLEAYGKLVLNTGGTNDISQTLIWRNSLNKHFSFGICGGTHAWACSNLMMFGEFVEFRRHTNGMNEDELGRIVTRGINNIMPELEHQEQWHRNLHEYKLNEEQTRALAYDAIQQDVISKRKINEFDSLLFGENHEYNPNELFGFHGACTQLLREQNMTRVVERQSRIYNFVNSYIESAA